MGCLCVGGKGMVMCGAARGELLGMACGCLPCVREQFGSLAGSRPPPFPSLRLPSRAPVGGGSPSLPAQHARIFMHFMHAKKWTGQANMCAAGPLSVEVLPALVPLVVALLGPDQDSDTQRQMMAVLRRCAGPHLVPYYKDIVPSLCSIVQVRVMLE